MTPADRAAWLARVEGMTRSERLRALVVECERASAWASWMRGAIETDDRHGVLGRFIEPAAHHANRALDLIAALEREAAAPYRDLCASCYQMAGALGAPVRFLDALVDAANGRPQERVQTRDLLPVMVGGAAMKESRTAHVCRWVYDDIDDAWDTDCGEKFIVCNDDTPFINGMRFCPFCGKALRERKVPA